MRIIFLVFVLLTSSACSIFHSTRTVLPLPPSYVVMLSSKYGSNTCMGTLIGAHYVLTAQHCKEFSAFAANQYGQIVEVDGIKKEDENSDLVLLTLKNTLYSEGYGVVNTPDRSQPAFLYGSCPHFWPHVPRVGMFVGFANRDTTGIVGSKMAWGFKGCGGDSGAPVVQNDMVVGVIQSSLASEVNGVQIPDGDVMFAAPSTVITLFLRNVDLEK